MDGENQNGQEQEQQENRETVPPQLVEDGTNVGTYLFLENYGMMPLTGTVSAEDVKIVACQYAIKGVLFTFVGVIAIVFPFLFGLAIEQLLAWLLILGGGVMLIQFFMLCGSHGRCIFLLLGALHFCVGMWLLLKPLEGLTALTFLLSGWFLAHGVLKVIMAWQIRHMRFWFGVLVSGLLSIFLGFLIIWFTPTYGLKLVGLICGGDLVGTGVSVLVIALIGYCHKGGIPPNDLESGSTREPLLDSNSTSIPAEASQP